MKKWIFSDKGKITGPLGLADSQEFIKNNSSSYAWNPSLSHWMPASHIKELELVLEIPLPPPTLDLPQELMDKFSPEKRKFIDQLDKFNEDINLTQNQLNEFNADTQHYKQLTTNLNKEISEVINNIEQQYAALEKSLASVNNSKH